MSAQEQKILDRLMANIWLLENIFWKYKDLVIFNQTKEKYKRFLFILYDKKDTYELFPAEIDEDKFPKTLNTLFSYYDEKYAFEQQSRDAKK